MPDTTVTRVQYFPRQFLRTEDFIDEQAYHLAMRRRHNIAHHTWGIVRGLELIANEDDGLAVQPGVAIDGYGRELIVAVKYPLPVGEQDNPYATFDNRDSDALDVWLIYHRTESNPAPSGYADCLRNGEQPAGRWREGSLIRLTTPDQANRNHRQPDGVPPGDRNFAPTRTPPDEGQWPVYLGQVIRNLDDPKRPFRVDMSNRPYAGLVGAEVTAPSGRTRVQLGANAANDERRFAIYTSGPEASMDASKLLVRLHIDRHGHTTIGGDTAVKGALSIQGKTLAFGAIEYGPGDETYQPLPWRIYRAIEKVEHQPDSQRGRADATAGPTPYRVIDQLRIEMGQSENQTNQVVIGVWSSEDKKFHPCLTVNEDCSVRVHGNLTVEGRLIEQQVRADPQLATETRNVALSSSLTGIAGANVLLPSFYRSQLRADFLRTLLSSKEEMQRIFAGLQNEDQRNDFADQLANNDKILNAIIDELVESEERMKLILARLTFGSKREEFVNVVIADAALFPVVLGKVLDDHLPDVVNGLTGTRPEKFVGELVKETDKLKAIVAELSKDDNARVEMADSLWALEAGIEELATSLNSVPPGQSPAKLIKFFDSLSDELKAALKAEICPEVEPPVPSDE